MNAPEKSNEPISQPRKRPSLKPAMADESSACAVHTCWLGSFPWKFSHTTALAFFLFGFCAKTNFMGSAVRVAVSPPPWLGCTRSFAQSS